MDVRIVDHSRRHSFQFLDIIPTLDAHMGTGGGNVPILLIFNNEQAKGQRMQNNTGEEVISIEGNGVRKSHKGPGYSEKGQMYTLNTAEVHKVCYRSKEPGNNTKYVLRKLTPNECAKLQGFPEWWTDGVEGTDYMKYRLWGNGVCLPCVCDIIGRLVNELKKEEEQQ